MQAKASGKPGERHPDDSRWLRALALMVLLYFWRPLLGLGVMTPGSGDNDILVFPFRYVLGQALRLGRLPLWEPGLYSGFPFFAEPHASVFYPVNLALFGLLPVMLAFNWALVLSSCIAVAGTYFLARRLKVSPAGSFVAAVSFGFGGYVIGLLGNVAHLHPAVWLPVGLLAVDHLVESSRPRYAAALGAVVALQMLSGHPQVTFICVLGYAVYGVNRLWHAARQARLDVRPWPWRPAMWLAAAAVLAVGLSAVQLVPTLEFVGESTRESFVRGQQLLGSLPPPGLATYLAPYLMKYVPELGFTSMNYLGLLPLTLALAGMGAALRGRPSTSVRPVDTRWRFLAWLALGSLVLALGRYGLVYVGLFYLPGFSLFRGPARFLLLTDIAMALLAGAGWDRLTAWLPAGAPGSANSAGDGDDTGETGDPVREASPSEGLLTVRAVRRISTWMAGAFGVLLLALIVGEGLLARFHDRIVAWGRDYVRTRVYGRPPHIYSLSHYYAQLDDLLRRAAAEIRLVNPRVIVPVLVFTATLALLTLWSQRRLDRRAWTTLGCALVVLDLFAFAVMGGNLQAVPAATYRQTPKDIRFLQRDRGAYRVYSWPVGALRTGVPALGSAFERGALASTEATYGHLLAIATVNTNLEFGLASPSGDTGLVPARVDKVMSVIESRESALGDRARLQRVQERASLLGLMGVKYLLSPMKTRPATAATTPNLSLVYNGDVKVYRNRQWLPRAFVVQRAAVARSEEKALASTTSPAFDARQMVILEEAPPPGYATVSAPKDGSAAVPATLVEDSPEQIEIEAKAFRPSWLVLADSYYPGWEASVDGRAARIYRADYLYRAVPLSPGDHRVVFRYRPRSLQVGGAITLFSLLAAAALLAADVVTRRRHRHHTST